MIKDTLNSKEKKKWVSFSKKHRKLGHVAIFLTETDDSGIGKNVIAFCDNCNIGENITDYSVW